MNGSILIHIKLLWLIGVVNVWTLQYTSGDQRAAVGNNVNITLSVNFTNSSSVSLTSSYLGYSGSDLFESNCSFILDVHYQKYKCSSTHTNTSITITVHLTNVILDHGGVYTLTSDIGAWDNVTLTVCEPANRPVLLSSVNNSLHVLQCKMNSRCFPPCKSCWSNYTYTWYERLSPGVSEASVIDGVTSESYSLAVTLPDGRGYYCSTSVAGTGTVSSVNTFWHVCHPNKNITCGLYGHNVGVYFVIAPMLQMNISDIDGLQILGVNANSSSVAFGNPVTSFQFGNFELIHPEYTCGIVVSNATVRDSGQYMCNISHFVVNNTWSVTLKQTLQLCEVPSSPYITAVSNNGTQVLVCTLVHDSSDCSIPEHYLWLISGTLSASNMNQNLSVDAESCYNTTYACCVAWRSDACVAVSQPYIAPTMSPDPCQVSPTVEPSTGDTSNTLAIILGVTIGGGVLLIVVIIVVIYCCIRKIKTQYGNTLLRVIATNSCMSSALAQIKAQSRQMYAGPGGAEIVDNEAYGSEAKQDKYAYGGGKYADGDDGVALEVKDNYAYDSSHKTDDYGRGYGGGGMMLEDNPSYGGGVPVAANTQTPAECMDIASHSANGNKEGPNKTKKPDAVKPQPGESYAQVTKSQLKAKPPVSPAADMYAQAKPNGKANGATTQVKMEPTPASPPTDQPPPLVPPRMQIAEGSGVTYSMVAFSDTDNRNTNIHRSDVASVYTPVVPRQT